MGHVRCIDCKNTVIYIAQLDDLLGIPETTNIIDVGLSYDIRVFNEAIELKVAILKQKNVQINGVYLFITKVGYLHTLVCFLVMNFDLETVK